MNQGFTSCWSVKPHSRWNLSFSSLVPSSRKVPVGSSPDLADSFRLTLLRRLLLVRLRVSGIADSQASLPEG